MSEGHHNRPRPWVWLTLVALLVLYPLSVGPVAWIAARADSPAIYAFARTLYSPLRALSSRSKTAQDILSPLHRLVGISIDDPLGEPLIVGDCLGRGRPLAPYCGELSK
jgi:hypothetical protein